MKKILSGLLLLFFVFGITACGTDITVREPEIQEGERPVSLILDSDEVNAYCGERISLPVPSFSSGSTQVDVEIMTADGSIYIPKHRYDDMPYFRAYEPGAFYAIYSAEAQGKSFSAIAKIYVGERTESSGVVIDGVLNDAAYGEIPTYVTGINGNMSLKMAFVEDGICIGAEVLDDNLIYNTYVSKKFSQSDGIEICLDLGGKFENKLNSRCLKIQMNVNDVMWISRASSGLALYELDERLVTYSEYKIQYHGTRTDVASDNYKTYTDRDIGYSVEVFLSYDLLGFRDLPDVIGVTCAQRDISSNVTAEYQVGASGNRYFSETYIPDGLVEISQPGSSFEFDQFTSTSFTVLYNKCYLTGNKGIGQNRTGIAIAADGVKEEAIWENAPSKTVISGSATAIFRYLVRQEGLYVFAEVFDDTLSENVSADIYANDCIQIAIADGSVLSSGELPVGIVKSRVLTLSATGQTDMAYLNRGDAVFGGGFDCVKAVRKTDGGYCAEAFIPAYEIGMDFYDVCGLCFGFLNNEDSVSAFEDMVFSCERTSPNGYEIVIKGE
ncbi:MAG: hypothetical protein ACI4ST_03955 [Candidatus Gallimonas sp.]